MKQAPGLVLLLAVGATGCGSSNPRVLQSVTASPASADAKQYPSGKVQFTATGVFNTAPTHVTPLPPCSTAQSNDACITAWSTSPDIVATVDQSGIARCLPGQSGKVTIGVAVAGDRPIMSVAELTCP